MKVLKEYVALSVVWRWRNGYKYIPFSCFNVRCPPFTAHCSLLAACCLLLTACGGPNTPLDAGTRQAIDSIAAAEVRQARMDIDSLCKLDRTILLPRLVDSIKQKRVREIQEQLKTVPK